MGVFGGDEPPPPNFEISAPFNFKHTHHVQADPRTSTGFSVSRFHFTRMPHQLLTIKYLPGIACTNETSLKGIWYY